jgi:phospho-N-acetylmuramoyl-pentapeptide-transferase
MALALLLGVVCGRRIIGVLRRRNVAAGVRTSKLKDMEMQQRKSATPTMGGIIILLSTLLPALLLCNLANTYTWLLIAALSGLSLLGFADDYIKVFKHDKRGISGGLKIMGQMALGLTVGFTIMLHDGMNVRTKRPPTSNYANAASANAISADSTSKTAASRTITTIPFFKNNEFDYKSLVPSFLDKHKDAAGWAVFILMCILVVMAVSNGVNITDGLDGLAAGVSVLVGTALGILAYLSSNVIYADYLSIMYIPNSGEVVVFMAALVGALIGFLWYNAHPSQVFMGDTGSLAIGGVIAVCSIIIRKELMLPILCGIFFVESVSVIVQLSAFRYSKWRSGVRRGVFLMAPLHHHYQKMGFHESKIVMRFYIAAALFALAAVLSLKIR